MPWTDQQIAFHIEMDHERELAPGTEDVRGIHAEMHWNHKDWDHTHSGGVIRFEGWGFDEPYSQREVDIQA